MLRSYKIAKTSSNLAKFIAWFLLRNTICWLHKISVHLKKSKPNRSFLVCFQYRLVQPALRAGWALAPNPAVRSWSGSTPGKLYSAVREEGAVGSSPWSWSYWGPQRKNAVLSFGTMPRLVCRVQLPFVLLGIITIICYPSNSCISWEIYLGYFGNAVWGRASGAGKVSQASMGRLHVFLKIICVLDSYTMVNHAEQIRLFLFCFKKYFLKLPDYVIMLSDF